MNIIGKMLDELYRIFDIVNREKFDNILPTPVITIQKTRGRNFGHFSLNRIMKLILILHIFMNVRLLRL